MLSVIMLSVIMLSVILLNVIMLSVILLNVIMLSVVVMQYVMAVRVVSLSILTSHLRVYGSQVAECPLQSHCRHSPPKSVSFTLKKRRKTLAAFEGSFTRAI